MADMPRMPNDSVRSTHQCPLCHKSYAREATCRRHYYYCRSRPADAGSSRRKSCAACVRAKTRCIRAAEGACERCRGRGDACEFEGEEAGEGDTATVPVIDAPVIAPVAPFVAPDTTLVLSRRSSHGPADWPANVAVDLSLAFPGPADFAWDLDLAPDMPDTSQMIVTVPSLYGGMPACGLSRNGRTLLLWDFAPAPTPRFGRREFARAQQNALAVLALQIMCAYPAMMLHKATLPPFISPVLYEWTRSGAMPQLQPLVACFNIVRLLSTRSRATARVPWTAIQQQQTQILAEYKTYDRWGLLASFQALLVYCLVRVREGPNDYGLDGSLAQTTNTIFNAIVADRGGVKKVKYPESPDLTWADWIFGESLKRTILVFEILNLVVHMVGDVEDYLAGCGHVIVPLTSSAAVWRAPDLQTWRTEFIASFKGDTIYGVSVAGELVQIRVANASMSSIPHLWEDWVAEVGEIGTLVMTVGLLLKQ